MIEVHPNSTTVLTERAGAVTILTLNRPDKLNAANLEMQEVLLDRLVQVASDQAVRALVLTGAGKSFSAGGDRDLLRQIAAGQLAEQDRLGRVHAETIRCMLGLCVPVIAAVSGPAVGYAAGLVAMCDIVVIGEDGFLSDPHVTFGIGATTATQLIWPRRAPEGVVREILMTGRRVGAREAVAIGLANRLCPAGDELVTACAIADHIAALPPAGVQATKAAFNAPLLSRAETMLGSALPSR